MSGESTQREAVHPTLSYFRQAVGDGQAVATVQGRSDLKHQLDEIFDRVAATPIPVVVCGEFKRGKSTLINAVLQDNLCPVDAAVVTAVPTTVKYASEPTVIALTTAPDGTVEREQFDRRAIQNLVTETNALHRHARERAVEIGLDHRMLRSGLCLVDTPGVGGLDSAHGLLTLGALRQAIGLLVVTDAAQELTGPELSFLRTAVERCPRAALVVTKTDLYPRWQQVVELDRQHLGWAGLRVPVIPVSSLLRLRARQDRRLDAESGYVELITFLARDVVADFRASAARSAAGEVDFVVAQLQQKTEVERLVLDAPERRQAVVARLDQTETEAAKLASPTATWQQTLGDGVQDLVADVEHELQRRLRMVLRDAEEEIGQGDPLQNWSDIEAWLRRQVAIVTVETRDLLIARSADLATVVAEQFDLQAMPMADILVTLVGDTAELVPLAAASTWSQPGGKLTTLLVAARTGFYLPMVLGGVVAGFLPALAPFAVGASVALGAGIGRKIIKDERIRQRTYRQQQARAAVAKFVDDVAFVMNKQTRDGLRATQRQLRDHFQERAASVQRSAVDLRETAQRTARLDQSQARARRAELDQQVSQLAKVQATTQFLAASRG